MRSLEESVCEVLSRINAIVGDIALVIPHKANMLIIDSSAKRLDIPIERRMINLQEYGNTIAGSILLALSEAVEQSRINNLIILVGFDDGLT